MLETGVRDLSAEVSRVVGVQRLQIIRMDVFAPILCRRGDFVGRIAQHRRPGGVHAPLAALQIDLEQPVA